MLILCKIFFLSIFILYVRCNKTPYDTYRGCPISDAELKERIKKNTTFWCVTEIEQCDPDEGRRLEGTCNNLNNPTRGAPHTPYYRILPADFDTDSGDFEPRKASDGGPLPLVRYLRTSLLPTGKGPDPIFTQLATHALVFYTGDVTTVQDSVNYVLWKPYCCLAKGKTDPECIPNEIPADDPVHRFSGQRCLNLTRPLTFQATGCINNGTVPERIVSSTPTMDLSQIYPASKSTNEKKWRKFKGGLVQYEVEDGRIWPPSTKTKPDLCLLNQPNEPRCHATTQDGANTILGVNLFTIWLWRHHNNIATTLSRLNPCWDDDMLFYTARDINIAIVTQIFYYELFPLLMGRNNLLKDSVISSSPGFRNIYNKNITPQISLEFIYALRWFHIMQESSIKMFDKDGYYLKEFPLVNMTLRTGYLAVDDNIDYITQGSFRQASGKADNIVDPDISDLGFGPLQSVTDIPASDLSKGRYFGFQPYVNYRKKCFGKSYKSFDDLKDAFDAEKLQVLKDRYKSVQDIDLMAGLWLERHVAGGHIPETMYCIMTDQLRRFPVSDRHWYESSERPYAFTPEQLAEIRKASISRLLCDVGDKVTRIQPHGFIQPGPKNRIRSCEEIRNIDHSVWQDFSCYDNDNYKKK